MLIDVDWLYIIAIYLDVNMKKAITEIINIINAVKKEVKQKRKQLLAQCFLLVKLYNTAQSAKIN